MYYVERGKKYKNKSTFYDGYWYSSLLEANHARTLDLLKRAKDEGHRVVSWKRQYRISLDIGKHHITDHLVDFYVEFADGRVELHEAKGYETDVYKMKRKLLEALFLEEHPEITYRIIK